MPTTAPVLSPQTTCPFCATMEGFPGLAWLRDGGRYIWAHNFAQLGLSDADAIGHTAAEVFGSDLEFEFRKNDARVLAGEAVQVMESLASGLWITCLWRVLRNGHWMIGGSAVRIYEPPPLRS